MKGKEGVLSPEIDGNGGGVKRRRIWSGQFVRWIDGVRWRSSGRRGRVVWSFFMSARMEKMKQTSGPGVAATQTRARVTIGPTW